MLKNVETPRDQKPQPFQPTESKHVSLRAESCRFAHAARRSQRPAILKLLRRGTGSCPALHEVSFVNLEEQLEYENSTAESNQKRPRY